MKYKFRESKQRQRESRQSCTWFIKEARTYCHSPAVKGSRFCKTHIRYMKSWLGKKHKASYSEANTISWEGWSKFDD